MHPSHSSHASNRLADQSRLAQAATNSIATSKRRTGRIHAARTAKEDTGSNRMAGLAPLNAAMNVYNTANALGSSASQQGSIDQLGGNASANAAPISAISISGSIGQSKSASNSTANSSTAQGSTLAAGGTLSISANGDKSTGNGNLTMIGTNASAGKEANLSATGNIDLLAAANTSEMRSSNSGSNASMGATFALGGQQNGLSFQAGAQGSRGKANGDETTYSNTTIRVGSADSPGTLNISSGGNTTLKGATASANTINADIKGKLVIESLQDTSNYDSKQTSVGAGVSLCIPPICYGTMVVVNVNAAQAKIDGDYTSVGEQSALRAGDGGFNVKVGGDTTLKGGAITSTQKAIDDKANSFATGGKLTATDLQNKSELDAKSMSIAMSSSGGGSAATSTSGSMGYGSVQDSRSSTTTAAISGVAGNKDARTGDSETGIKPVFTAADAAKVDKSLGVQTGVTAQFGQNASKAVGDYAGSKFKEAQAKGDAEGMALWKEGGAARVALHGVVGALTGGADGALGAVTSQTAVPLLGEQIAKLDIPVELKQALVLASGVGVGAVTGGGAGAASGGNATLNNYLTATDLRNRDKKLKGCQANGDTTCEVKVLKEYDLLSARNTAAINYNTVLSEVALQAEKTQLEQLVNDPTNSAESKAQAQRSINELNVAINVIQKSPILKDAAQLGLVVADVVLLGQLAAAKMLTSTAVREYVLSKTGKEITPDAAAVIANNFYREGAAVEYGGSRVITNPNEAVFWSGRTGNVGGIDAAKTIADQYRGRTLEQLIETRQITMPMYDPNIPASVKAWQSISTELAKNASGEVRAVLGAQMRPQSIWETYELPELMRNPAVTTHSRD